MKSEPTSAGGKPVRLADIFSEADFERIEAALKISPRLLDEDSARFYPAAVHGGWLDAIGLPDLAARARAELAETTSAGDQLTDMSEQFQGRSRMR